MKFGYNGLVAFGMFEIIDYDRPEVKGIKE